MGVRFPGAANQQPIGALPTNGESAVLISNPLNISLDFQQIIIIAYVDYTPGASATTVTWALRRGSGVLGAVITTQPINGVVPGNRIFFTILFSDIPGAVAGIQYSLTASQTAATAPGTISDGNILVFAL